MASYIASSQAGVGSSNSLTIDKPSGAQENDILIAGFRLRHVGVEPTSISLAGWTLLREDTGSRAAILYKQAGASEPANYTFTATGVSLPAWAGVMVCYRGLLVPNVSDLSAAVETSAPAAASITTTAANAWVVTFFLAALPSSGPGTITPPPGETERVEYEFTGGIYFLIEVNDELQAAAGATGTKTASSSVSYLFNSGILAMNPVATAAGRKHFSQVI